MKTSYLFPTVFCKIGWSLFIPSLLFGLCYLFISDNAIDIGGTKTFALFDGLTETSLFCITDNTSWTDEFIIILLTISLLFIGFSREEDEDECIANIRMNSIVWAIMVNSIILIVGTLLIFGLPYFNFMAIHMFSLMLLFIIKYKTAVYLFRRNNSIQESILQE